MFFSGELTDINSTVLSFRPGGSGSSPAGKRIGSSPQLEVQHLIFLWCSTLNRLRSSQPKLISAKNYRLNAMNSPITWGVKVYNIQRE